MTTKATQKPIQDVRLGTLRAAIWANPTQFGTRYSVTLERRYRNEDGTWSKTDSYGRDDLLVLAKLLDRTHDAILELQAGSREAEREANDASDSESPSAAATKGHAAKTR